MTRLLFAFFLLIITTADSYESEFIDDSGDYDYDDSSPLDTAKYNGGEKAPVRTDVCIPQPLGGVDWILSIRQPDYGWEEETHRAVIALAINNWKNLTPQEIRQIELQLEVELTKALLRNNTSLLHPNDLALYINALIATKRNPRNFYGIDLVDWLLNFVSGSYYQVHPVLLLTLCNANVVPKHRLSLAQWIQQNRRTGRENIEYLGLALNAFECLKTLDYEVDGNTINVLAKNLAEHQQLDGSFGNVYRTALVVQALASAPSSLDWNKQLALDYLRSKSTVDVNMVSAYLIELALNSDRYRFIKDLYPDLYLGPAPGKQDKDDYFVQYTVRVGKYPDIYFTISIKVPRNSNFFYIMNESAKHDAKFNFTSYTDRNGEPNIFSISGVPNDAEENLYWRLCLQTDIDHNRHNSTLLTIHKSPVNLTPRQDEHVIYWYRDSDCEQT